MSVDVGDESGLMWNRSLLQRSAVGPFAGPKHDCLLCGPPSIAPLTHFFNITPFIFHTFGQKIPRDLHICKWTFFIYMWFPWIKIITVTHTWKRYWSDEPLLTMLTFYRLLRPLSSSYSLVLQLPATFKLRHALGQLNYAWAKITERRKISSSDTTYSLKSHFLLFSSKTKKKKNLGKRLFELKTSKNNFGISFSTILSSLGTQQSLGMHSFFFTGKVQSGRMGKDWEGEGGSWGK